MASVRKEEDIFPDTSFIISILFISLEYDVDNFIFSSIFLSIVDILLSIRMICSYISAWLELIVWLLLFKYFRIVSKVSMHSEWDKCLYWYVN